MMSPPNIASTPDAGRPPGFSDAGSVAELAAQTVLSVPEVKNSKAIAGLLPFLLTPQPEVEALPGMFLPAATRGEVDEAALLEIAVGGKILYAHVRWLDELADSVERSMDPLGSVHRLSGALVREARSHFAAGLRSSGKESAFFSSFSDLNTRHAASLALDGTYRNTESARLSFEDYVEHAKARAAPLRAPLDALLVLVDSAEGVTRAAHCCFEFVAAAKQLRDDTLDVEEDYRDRRLSWVVSETLRHLGNPDPPPEADEFYEAALLGGFIDRNLAAAEELYRKALALAVGRFPGCVAFLENETQETRAMRYDMAQIVASSGDPAASRSDPAASSERKGSL